MTPGAALAGPCGTAQACPPHVATGRTLVMGVVNVTPDSFSDGGHYLAADAAVAHGLALVAEGADLVDVGGESTRPGAAAGRRGRGAAPGRCPSSVALAAAGVAVSIDTMRARVAAAGPRGRRRRGQRRQRRAGRRRTWRGSSPGPPRRTSPCTGAGTAPGWPRSRTTTTWSPTWPPSCAPRLDALAAAGVDVDRVVLDPGLGFAKDAGHNWALLAGLDELAGLGRPLLVGASRKGFLGALLADADGEPRPVGGPRRRDRRRLGRRRRPRRRVGGAGARGAADRRRPGASCARCALRGSTGERPGDPMAGRPACG